MSPVFGNFGTPCLAAEQQGKRACSSKSCLVSFYDEGWPTHVIIICNEKQPACNTQHFSHNGRTKKQIQVQSSPYADGTAERSPGAKRGTSARLLRSALAG